MRGHGSQLGRRKEAAIAALLSTRTTEEVAREAGVSTRTILRWMKDPEFREEWLAARRDGLSQAMARLQNAAGAAAATLIKAMVDSNLSATKVKAARSILEISQRSVEMEDIEIRIAKLERNHAKQ